MVLDFILTRVKVVFLFYLPDLGSKVHVVLGHNVEYFKSCNLFYKIHQVHTEYLNKKLNGGKRSPKADIIHHTFLIQTTLTDYLSGYLVLSFLSHVTLISAEYHSGKVCSQ